MENDPPRARAARIIGSEMEREIGEFFGHGMNPGVAANLSRNDAGGNRVVVGSVQLLDHMSDRTDPSTSSG
jgi:hypothetical protein